MAFVLLIPSARRKTQWNLYLTRRNEICTPLNRPDFSPNLSGKRGKAFRFTNAWEQRNFDEVFVSLPNNTLSRSDLNDSDGTSQDVHYGDVLIKFNEILDLRETELPFISAGHSKNINALGFLKDGDVVIADTAEDSTVGKSVELHNVGSKVVESGLHTMPYRPNPEGEENFVGDSEIIALGGASNETKDRPLG